jgi:hypothetical protein
MLAVDVLVDAIRSGSCLLTVLMYAISPSVQVLTCNKDGRGAVLAITVHGRMVLVLSLMLGIVESMLGEMLLIVTTCEPMLGETLFTVTTCDMMLGETLFNVTTCDPMLGATLLIVTSCDIMLGATLLIVTSCDIGVVDKTWVEAAAAASAHPAW